MRTLLDLIAGTQRPDTLLVLLPPALASLDDLIEQGFVVDVRARGLPVDVLLAEVTSEQVMAKTAVSSLHAEVILPAVAQGYRHIWLAGISLGAFNALHYAAIHAGSVSGLKLIAPYAGTSDILSEIESAGGPAAWAALPGRSSADERVWWHWLSQESAKSGTKAAAKADAALPVYVGLASEDRFLRGQRLLASLVPAAHVDEIAGDHSWLVWRALWQRWLDRSVLTATGASPLYPMSTWPGLWRDPDAPGRRHFTLRRVSPFRCHGRGNLLPLASPCSRSATGLSSPIAARRCASWRMGSRSFRAKNRRQRSARSR